MTTIGLLLILFSIYLSIPGVQTNLGKAATKYLKKDFDVDINIDKVDLSYIGNIHLRKVFIKNHHQDTLIFVEKLKTSLFSYRNILNNKMEFGEIALVDFQLNINTYEGERDDALTVFVEKFDDGTGGEEPSGFLLTSTKLALSNGYVEIIDKNFPEDKPVFFKKLYGTANNFKLAGPDVYANIRDMSFVEHHQLQIDHFTTDFTYTKKFMRFLNTKISTENSEVFATVHFDYDRDDLSDFNNKVKISGTISEAALSLIDLNKFYGELASDDVVNFTSVFDGTLNDLHIKDLDLISDSGTLLKGDFNLKNAFGKATGFSLNSQIDRMVTDYNYVSSLLPNMVSNSLPKYGTDLGNVSLRGNVFINEEHIDAAFSASTDLGRIVSDMRLTNLKDINNANYKGDLEFIDLELGSIISNPLVGKLSMKTAVDGKGFTIEKMNSSVNGLISKHEYLGYTYQNITLNGLVQNKQFNGEIEVNDENIKLNFNGLADFSTSVATFDFKTTVDYCDLNIINLFKRDSISNIKGDIEIKMQGNSMDDLAGRIVFANSLYTNQKGNYFFKDFEVNSSFQDSIRTITVNSTEIINGQIQGKFKFNELGRLTQNSIGSIYSNYKPHSVSDGQYLDFRFNIYNHIVEVFYPEITLSANTSISGSINSDNNLFRLNMKSPEILAYEQIISEVGLTINNKNPLFNTQLTIENIASNYYDISKLHLVNITLNDTLYFKTTFKGGAEKKEQFNMSFYHTFNKNNESVFGIQKSDFTFKEKTWFVNPTDNKLNKVVYDNKTNRYDLKSFLISSADQKIDFSGVINDTISKNLTFNFDNVKLVNITPDVDSLKIEGTLNGNLNYNQQFKQLKPTANFSVADFNINNSHQGDLNVRFEGKNSVKIYELDIDLERFGNTKFSALGEVDFSQQESKLDVLLNFEDFKLDAFSPLGEDVFTNIRGFAYGEVALSGLLKNPTMDGALFLDQAGMYFPYLNVDYEFEGTSVIGLKDQSFNFEDVTLRDTRKNTRGSLTGDLSHFYFDNWELDLAIDTGNLLVLDTEEKENALYYGAGFLEGNATIKGPTDKLVIDVIGKTKKGTHFVIPISDVKTIETSQLVQFVSKEKQEVTDAYRQAYISDKLKGLSLNFNLEVTKDAIIEMVLDKSTGSYLKGSGTGNLQLALDTKDKFDMYGDFIVDNGFYNFKYGGFIIKPFTVRKGGSISWSGDPLTADINIEAVYRVSANPKSLLENITANRKIPIDLITRFSGALFNSQREFDIEMPNSSSTVASELEFKLNKNKTTHFIALLVSGSFYNESNIAQNSNAVLYETGFDMLSNAFDNIFNQADNRFKLKPVYTVGERNKIENLNIDDQLAIALDYQVNDRIIINGTVGVPIGSKEQSSVIGEVNVEFLMNEEGTLRSSIFNRQNEIQYTEEEEGYTQGVGMSYQIDFDSGRELLEKLRLKKVKKNDSILVKKPVDTLVKNTNLVNFKNKKKK